MSSQSADDRSSKRGAAPVGPSCCILLTAGERWADEEPTHRVLQSIRIEATIIVTAKCGYAGIIGRHAGGVGKNRRGKMTVDRGDAERCLVTRRRATWTRRLSLFSGFQ